MRKACVLGAGAWGTAIAMVLEDLAYQVVLWDRTESVVDEINRNHRAVRLQGLELPQSITATSDPEEAVRDASIVMSAIPSTGVREVARLFAPSLPEDCVLVSATKGFDPDTVQRPTEVWTQEAPHVSSKIAVVSGPNFAIEVARRLPSCTVVAAADPIAREKAQSALMTNFLRAYTHWDVIGVELGGSLKNIIAMACGIVEGMGLGYNAQAALVSRGIAEMTRLGVAMGADPLTFAGLSGIGDLVLTATGHLSRNRQAGIAVGRGESVESFIDRTGYTVEGLATVKSAIRLADAHSVAMPITSVMYRILYQGLPAYQGLQEIMLRERRSESEWTFPNSPLQRL